METPNICGSFRLDERTQKRSNCRKAMETAGSGGQSRPACVLRNVVTAERQWRLNNKRTRFGSRLDLRNVVTAERQWRLVVYILHISPDYTAQKRSNCRKAMETVFTQSRLSRLQFAQKRSNCRKAMETDGQNP